MADTELQPDNQVGGVKKISVPKYVIFLMQSSNVFYDRQFTRIHKFDVVFVSHTTKIAFLIVGTWSVRGVQ
jgi:hypothetical protein